MIRNPKLIAADLKKLASGSSDGEVALQDLADTLHNDSNAVPGAGLATTYSPAVLLADGDPGLRRTANLVELARDVLIFVPVIYTWWKIAGALQAFRSYKGTDTFLLAWEDGFGGKIDPLSSAAKVVAVVVLVVILLTVLAHYFRARYEESILARQQRLSRLLAELSLSLNQRLAKAPDVTKTELAALGRDMAVSVQSMDEALQRATSEIVAAVDTEPGSRLDQMFQKWTAAADRLTDLGTRLQGTQEVIVELRAAQQGLAGMAESLSAETRRLLEALSSERDVSGQEAHAHRQLAAEVTDATRQLGDSLRGLNERSEQFNELVLRLVYVVDSLDAQAGAVP